MPTLDINKLLHALDNEENEDIIANTYEQISKVKNDILQKLQLSRDVIKSLHQKLKQYRHIDTLEGIRYGAYIRWISLKNPDPDKIKLTNGGFICNIEILNDENNLARVAATGAFIHNSAALLASKDAPISSSSIIEFIPEAIRKIIK